MDSVTALHTWTTVGLADEAKDNALAAKLCCLHPSKPLALCLTRGFRLIAWNIRSGTPLLSLSLDGVIKLKSWSAGAIKGLQIYDKEGGDRAQEGSDGSPTAGVGALILTEHELIDLDLSSPEQVRTVPSKKLTGSSKGFTSLSVLNLPQSGWTDLAATKAFAMVGCG